MEAMRGLPSGVIGITGATGFLGRHLMTYLELQGAEVKPISFRSVDLDSIHALIKQLKNDGIRSFVHLGWPASSTEDYKNSKENIEASSLSINLGRSCVEAGIRFFGMGSPAEFFPEASQYAQSKRACRDGLQALIDCGKVAWLRPHYVFDNKTWPKFVGDAALGLQVRILDDSKKSFIHIEDVVGAIAIAITQELTGEIDILHTDLVRPSELLAALGYECQVLGEMKPHDSSANLKTASILASGWRAVKTKEILELG